MFPRVSSFESNREPLCNVATSRGGNIVPDINGSSLILNNTGAAVAVKCIPSFVEAIIPAF